MDVAENYLLAWSLYLLAVASSQLIVWRMLRALASVDLRISMQLIALAIWITPIQLESEQSYWVPVFMVAIMDGISFGADTALERLQPMWAVMLVMLVIVLLLKWRRSRRLSAAAQPSRAK